jgi:hypothetical protein
MTHDDLPPGWSHDPSRWGQRLPLVVLALIGFAAAGHFTPIATASERLLGDAGRVLLAAHRPAAPPYGTAAVPWTAFAAAGYALAAIVVLLGGARRWRTAPWLVLLCGAVVAALGAAGVLLVAWQPLVHGTWCAACVVAAAVGITLVSPAMEEVLASLQHLARTWYEGGSVWCAFRGAAEPVPERPVALDAHVPIAYPPRARAPARGIETTRPLRPAAREQAS